VLGQGVSKGVSNRMEFLRSHVNGSGVAIVVHGKSTRAPPFADTDNAILLEPRIARNKRIRLIYTYPSAILSEATVFCVTGGHRG
jgi:hypothetical protein